MSAAPDRSHGVDDVAGRQREAVRDDRLSRWALADGPTGGLQLVGSGSPVNGAVDAPAAAEIPVGRVDHRVDPLGGDVAAGGLQPWGHRAYPEVLDPETEVGASLSSEDEWAGAVWATFSPHLVNVTELWMLDEPLEVPGLVTCSSGSAVPLAGT